MPPEEREHHVLDEDAARVSPLKHANLNCLGRYSFAARPPREGLRALRAPATVVVQGVGAVRYRWTVGPSQSTISSRPSAMLSGNRST